MREKLIDVFCSILGAEPDYQNEDGIRFVEELIANGVTVQQWIPVTERLPEENTAVMTYRESGIEVEYRWHKGWDNDEFTPCPVTHWMPLPEPPKEG